MAERVECAVIGAGVLSPSTGIVDSHGLMLEYLGEAEEHGAALALYTLTGRPPFRRLVYPVARRDWLGVHVTIDLGGRVKFGPDISWIDRVDYRFDGSREGAFYRAIRDYYPGLKNGALQPGYTGIRPKIHGPGEPAPDFLIQGPRDHGVAGLVNLYGIESPGLTSSLAIADHVAALLAPH